MRIMQSAEFRLLSLCYLQLAAYAHEHLPDSPDFMSVAIVPPQLPGEVFRADIAPGKILPGDELMVDPIKSALLVFIRDPKDSKLTGELRVVIFQTQAQSEGKEATEAYALDYDAHMPLGNEGEQAAKLIFEAFTGLTVPTLPDIDTTSHGQPLQ